MRTSELKALALVIIATLACSCVSKRKLTYLQYSDKSFQIENRSNTTGISITPPDYRIMPYDNLYIRVITPDPQWSALFNLDVGTSGLTQESAALSGYTVDSDGRIDIPYVGKVDVGGETLDDIRTRLDSIFENYVTDASITVKLVNNYVSVIGEVISPGRYLLTKDRINIFEALSLAGDLSSFSDREKIQLIRPSQYGPIIKEFSLSDRSILSSEFYYIMPNDIIYAKPMQGRPFQINTTVWTLLLTTLTSTLGMIAFFRTL